MLKIKQYNSPNKSARRGKIPTMIVLHTSEGTFAGGISWLCNPKSEASTHFFVSKKGEVAQMVDIKDMAWGNGTNISDPKSKLYYKKSINALVRQNAINANLFSISIENEGIFAKDAGKLTPAQFAANVELIREIRRQVKADYGTDIPIDDTHITTHGRVTPEHKPNCGKGVDIPALVSAVALACK